MLLVFLSLKSDDNNFVCLPPLCPPPCLPRCPYLKNPGAAHAVLFHSLLPSSPLCDFVPRSLFSPFYCPCQRGKSFDLLQHLTWRPTWRPNQPAHLASARQPGGPVHPCIRHSVFHSCRLLTLFRIDQVTILSGSLLKRHNFLLSLYFAVGAKLHN